MQRGVNGHAEPVGRPTALPTRHGRVERVLGEVLIAPQSRRRHVADHRVASERPRRGGQPLLPRDRGAGDPVHTLGDTNEVAAPGEVTHADPLARRHLVGAHQTVLGHSDRRDPRHELVEGHAPMWAVSSALRNDGRTVS